MNPLLQASQIKKRFNIPKPVDILRGIDLTVYPQDTVAIMGASGEGKSTLLHILSTLDKPSSGSLHILGQDALARNSSSLRLHHIGFVFQTFYLLEEETALGNILMPTRIAGKSLKHRAEELLEKVGMQDSRDKPAKYLSGGEKQRIAIARALIQNPSLIFADEPTGNLDRTTAQEITSLLLTICHQNNSALILVTHDPAIAQKCHRTLLLKSGLLTTS